MPILDRGDTYELDRGEVVRPALRAIERDNAGHRLLAYLRWPNDAVERNIFLASINADRLSCLERDFARQNLRIRAVLLPYAAAHLRQPARHAARTTIGDSRTAWAYRHAHHAKSTTPTCPNPMWPMLSGLPPLPLALQAEQC
jgi:hypothetical protein